MKTIVVTTETPTGKPQNEMDQEDAVTSALSNLAYSTAKVGKKRSRFFFTIETNAEVIADIKQSMTKKKVEPIDAEVQTRLKQYRKDAPDQLKGRIAEVREFFLTEIAPRTLASSGGTIQATEVVQQLLETEVDQNIMSRFDNMVNRAATLKLADFVLRYFDLPQHHLEAIMGTGSQIDPVMKAVLEQLKNMPTRAEMKTEVRKARPNESKNR